MLTNNIETITFWFLVRNRKFLTKIWINWVKKFALFPVKLLRFVKISVYYYYFDSIARITSYSYSVSYALTSFSNVKFGLHKWGAWAIFIMKSAGF